MDLCIYLFMKTFIYSFMHLFIQSFFHSFIYEFSWVFVSVKFFNLFILWYSYVHAVQSVFDAVFH
jgi:hypothetical protein